MADHPPPGIPAGFHWHEATSAIRILGGFIGDPAAVQAKVFENAEETAAKYQERIAAERKAREEAAQDVIFGLESVFTESAPAETPAAEGDAAPADELPLEE